MQAPTKSEAEAWLEQSSHYNQSKRERDSHHNEEGSENLSGNEEVLEDSNDERDEYPDVEEYEEEIEEDSQEQQEEEEGDNEEGGEEEEEELEELEDDEEGEGEVQETDPQEEQGENRDLEEIAEESRGQNTRKQARLPYGSPVKRAHTANDHRRHTSRALGSQRDRSPFDSTGKFMSERLMFERLTGKSLSPTRAPEEFLEYYEKFCKGFLLKKEKELEKKRRQKEEDELAQLQDKPTLISRPQSKPYVPLLERTPLLNARRERELEKIKQEKEDKMNRELEEMTFKPKINQRSKNLATSPTRERIMNVYLRSRNQYSQYSQSPLTQRKADRDAFQPKINPNSRNIVQAMRETASKDVVERLYHKADLGRAKKSELAKQLTPKFTPSLNKNTRKIAKQIEANYYNEHNTDTKQSSEKKRQRSEIESHRTSQAQYRDREESHLEQASDLELLDILKQFNSMLEQKNEVPINLQQLSSLMSAYSGKKKAGTDLAETVKPYPREHTEGHHEQYDEEEDDHEQIVHRQTNGDRPMRSYPPNAEEETNPMFNIEKNLMHIQDSLQDLKENGNRGSESLNSLYNPAVHQNEMQSSSHSLNKSKKSKHTDHHRDVTDRDQHEYVESEVMQSKNSIMTGRNQPASTTHHEKNMSATKSQKSNSHLTPSKHDVNDAEEIKSLGTNTKSAKKEDYSSPDPQKTSRKRAQTTTKKTKKTKVSPRFENESQIKTIKDAKSLNDVIAQAAESKNSIEGWTSQFEARDHHQQFQQFEEQRLVRDNQPERKLKGHVVEHSFGGYPKDAAQGLVQEDDNYRSNHPSEVSKPTDSAKKSRVDSVKEKEKEKWRSSQALKEQEKVEKLVGEDYERGKANSHAYIAQAKNQASQNSITASNKKSEKKEQSQKSSEKSVKEKRGRNQEDTQHRKSTTSSRDQNKKYSNNQDDQHRRTESDYEQEGKDRTKSGRGSRKVSFEQQSDSRRSSIFQEGSEGHDRHLTGSNKSISNYSGKKKPVHQEQGHHHSEKISTFANKQSNKRHEEEHRASEEDEVQSSIHGTPKVRSGDYMSFSANTLDQQPSFDDHQPPQNERRHMEDDESEGSRAPSIKQGKIKSIQGSPSKQNRGQFEVVTTETIQIEPQSAPRFSYAMDGTDKAIPTASSSGLKAMAEQIVKKFKAYDAQIKQTAREYKMSVSPPRTASPSPEHYDTAELEPKKESKVFKSVEKGSVAKSSRNEIRPSRGSIPGSLSSVQSGVDRRLGKK